MRTILRSSTWVTSDKQVYIYTLPLDRDSNQRDSLRDNIKWFGNNGCCCRCTIAVIIVEVNKTWDAIEILETDLKIFQILPLFVRFLHSNLTFDFLVIIHYRNFHRQSSGISATVNCYSKQLSLLKRGTGTLICILSCFIATSVSVAIRKRLCAKYACKWS